MKKLENYFFRGFLFVVMVICLSAFYVGTKSMGPTETNVFHLTGFQDFPIDDEQIQNHLNSGRIWPKLRDRIASSQAFGKRVTWKETDGLEMRQRGSKGLTEIPYHSYWYPPHGFIILTFNLPKLAEATWQAKDILELLNASAKEELENLTRILPDEYNKIDESETSYQQQLAELLGPLLKIRDRYEGAHLKKHAGSLTSSFHYCSRFNAFEEVSACLTHLHFGEDYPPSNAKMTQWSEVLLAIAPLQRFELMEQAKIEKLRVEFRDIFNRLEIYKEFTKTISACLDQANYCLYSTEDRLPRRRFIPLAIATTILLGIGLVVGYGRRSIV